MSTNRVGVNISQLVDGGDGSIAARYEYDAFGGVVVSDGAMAQENAYRFSTKYFIPDLGVYDYGYRLYEPQLGRWLNRDPIAENGGINLFAFVDNGAVNETDYLGLTIKGKCLDWYLDAYLDGYSKREKGNDFEYHKGWGSETDALTSLILRRMMKSKYIYNLVGATSIRSIQSLARHIEVRKNIVRKARGKKFGFPDGREDIREYSLDPTVKLKENPEWYYHMVNNSKTRVACNRGTKLVFFAGIGKWMQGVKTRSEDQYEGSLV